MRDEQLLSYEAIRKAEDSRISKVRQIIDHKSVIVGILRKKNLSQSDLTRFFKDYETIRDLSHDGIVKTIDIIDKSDEVHLVLEDWPSMTLSDVMKTRRISLAEFFHIAIKLAGILEYIHSRKIFHGNINSLSILISEDLSQVKVTEFGIDLLITAARTYTYDPWYVGNCLPYLAPEQTGRVNRSEEYRSDFYSLGVVFFEMLTGTVPFRSSDPLELIHCHIARSPVIVEKVAPEVPATVWDILLKLMAKSPEERYQSAAGVRADLEECRKRYKAGEPFESFPIGSKDIPDRFLIPLKLYGREKELAVLLDTFEEVCDGRNRLLLVTGESGIGKSALVHEIHKPVLAHRGYFISGKYEQFKSDSPYSAIIQAFKGLIHQLLSEKEQALSDWRESFKDVLGPNGGVITDIFPELELIVGKQPRPPQVGAEESRNRFNMCFESFASLFVLGQRPLVLFLDDLQWVDFPSISLLTSLLFSLETKYLYIIFSYRNNEVSDAHPFMEMINDIKNQGQKPKTITLGPLSNTLVRSMVVDFLKCSPQQGHHLGDHIFKKTAGNPFFVNQFLKTLYDKNIIVHDSEKGWQWNDQDIVAMQVTTNVLKLMMDNISNLPENTRKILMISSCIGNHFDPELLSGVLEKSLYDVLTDLKVAIEEGYVRHEDNTFKYNHDRIHEAAYSLITEEERVKNHLKIGEILLKRATIAQNLGKQLFYVTDQLNLGSRLIDKINGREKLFYLNMDAGKRAKETAAFDPALKYFLKAEKLLTQELREKAGDQLIPLYREIADSACLIGAYRMMDEYVAKAKALKPDLCHLVGVGEIEIRSHFARQDYKTSIDKSKQLLADLGVFFPENVTKKHIVLELVKIKRKLLGLTDDRLLHIPKMEDETQLAIAKTYYEMGISATLSDFILYGYIVLKRFVQVLDHGRHPYAGLCFLGYGALLAAGLNDIKGGIRFANLALQIVDDPEGKVAKHKVHVIYVALISQWNFPLPKCRTFAHNAYRLSREVGDQIYTALALMYRDFMAFLTSDDFSDLAKQVEKRVKITEQSGQRPMILFHKMILQLLEVLNQDLEIAHGLKGRHFDEDQIVPEWIGAANHTGLAYYYIILVCVNYYTCDHEKARDSLIEIKKHWNEVKNMMAGQLAFYFDSLNDLALYPSLSRKERRKALASVRRSLKKITGWKKTEPTKHEPWIYLIRAELAKITGRHDEAPYLYNKAIQAFRHIPSPIFHTMAIIRTANYYEGQGLILEASAHAHNALYVAKELGAHMPVRFIRERFADLTGKNAGASGSQEKTYSEGILDMATIIKSSQALSGEIVLSKLMRTIMTISLESAGAQKGLLILPGSEGELHVEVECHIDGFISDANEAALAIDKRKDLAHSVVNFVARTLQPVVLGCACQEGDFMSDPYIARNGIKSVLAAPMAASGKLKGVIYLENNLAPHVFSPERIRILDILASQAAISIENARLFENVKKAEEEVRTINLGLEDRVKDRTAELQEAYEKIKVMALTDALTGLPNRRMIVESLKEEIIRYRRNREPFSIAIADVDHFKSINDNYGHDCGDYVLVTLAQLMKSMLREQDKVARWGGEEFLFLLPRTDKNGARNVMEKVREGVQNHVFAFNGTSLAVTMTSGISEFDGTSGDIDPCVKKADEGLYNGKKGGRNRVILVD